MKFVVAVDGPAASGKGTVAGRLAEAFGLAYLDTGVLYRAVGYLAHQKEGDAATDLLLQAAAEGSALGLEDSGVLDHPVLRTRQVGELASRVAASPGVRAALLAFQQRFAAQAGGAVLDGRDIGTVIAPFAAAKLFVTAAPEVRAERRWKQLSGQGEAVSFDEILTDIRLRDARDSGRASAPLVQAADAVLLDTSEMDISQSVEAARRIVEAARGRWETSRPG